MAVWNSLLWIYFLIFGLSLHKMFPEVIQGIVCALLLVFCWMLDSVNA